MQQGNVTGGLQALCLLNELLFGSPIERHALLFPVTLRAWLRGRYVRSSLHINIKT
jgi:hypothetical protein